MRTVDAQRVHQPNDIVRQALDCVGDAAVIALADAAVVVEDHLEALAETRHLIAPIGADAAETADEDDREAGTVPLVVEVAIADRDARHEG